MGLENFFSKIITSDQVKSHKPMPGIFRKALLRTLSILEYTIMVGDSLFCNIKGKKNRNENNLV